MNEELEDTHQRIWVSLSMCPHCGAEPDDTIYLLTGYFLKCGECGAEGPKERDSIAAIEAWNKAASK